MRRRLARPPSTAMVVALLALALAITSPAWGAPTGHAAASVTKSVKRALGLSRALRAAQEAVASGTRDAAAVVAAARDELDRAGVEPDYLQLRSANDLSPVERVNGSTLLAVAARVGRARLIDNAILGGDQ